MRTFIGILLGASILLIGVHGLEDVEFVFDSGCPKNCSLNGQCVGGVCKCNDGFETADCSYPCGRLGQTCCQKQYCSDGTCLVHDGKADGVCSSYGGVYVNDNKAGCVSPNAYTRDCSCPDGYKVGCASVQSWRTKDYPDSELCFCHYADGADFAGFYQTSSAGCVVANPATGSCTCPAGTKASSPIETYVENKKDELRIFTCAADDSDSGSYAFGGLFEVDNDAKQTCRSPNPATGACSCPSPLSNPDLVSCVDYVEIESVSGQSSSLGACSTAHKNAGVIMSLAQSGFKQFLLDALDYAIKNSQKIKIPDISGHNYHVSGIEFDSLTFKDIAVTFPRRDALGMSFTGGAMNGAIGRIDVSDGIIGTHCDAHPFDLYDISIDFELDMALPVHAGRIQASFVPGSLQAKCGGVHCDIHGNVLCSTFAGDISDAITKAVQSDFPTSIAAEIQDAVAKQGAILSRNISRVATVFPITVPHSPIAVSADMSVTGCAVVMEHDPSLPVLQLPLHGSFFARDGPVSYAEALFSPPAISTPPIGTKDVQLCMSPYVFDAAMWVMFESETATVEITDADLPKNFPASLNTSNIIMRDIAPDINNIYPDDAMVIRVSFSASQPGAATASSNVTAAGLDFEFDLSAEFLVVSSNDTQPDNCAARNGGGYLCSAYRLSAAVRSNVTMSLVEGRTDVRLSAQVGGMQLAWSLVSSNVGTVQVSILDTLDVLLVPQAVKYINEKLANSTFSLPTTKGMVRLYDFTQPIYVPATNPGPQARLHVFEPADFFG